MNKISGIRESEAVVEYRAGFFVFGAPLVGQGRPGEDGADGAQGLRGTAGEGHPQGLVGLGGVEAPQGLVDLEGFGAPQGLVGLGGRWSPQGLAGFGCDGAPQGLPRGLAGGAHGLTGAGDFGFCGCGLGHVAGVRPPSCFVFLTNFTLSFFTQPASFC